MTRLETTVKKQCSTQLLKQLPSSVVAMKEIVMSGNIIPNTWYDSIRKPVKISGHGITTHEKDRPYLEAIIILSDIVYWYRPTEVRDEVTGKTIGWRKKFAADKLQRSYQQISDQFGISKTQAKEAVDWLVNDGIITREFRTVMSAKGPLNNVMFLEPVPQKIQEITHTPINRMVGESPSHTVGETPDRMVGDEYIDYTNNTTELERVETRSEKINSEQLEILGRLMTVVNEEHVKVKGIRLYTGDGTSHARNYVWDIFKEQCNENEKMFRLFIEQVFSRWDTLSKVKSLKRWAKKKGETITMDLQTVHQFMDTLFDNVGLAKAIAEGQAAKGIRSKAAPPVEHVEAF